MRSTAAEAAVSQLEPGGAQERVQKCLVESWGKFAPIPLGFLGGLLPDQPVAGFDKLSAFTGAYFNRLGSRVTLNKKEQGPSGAKLETLAGKPNLREYSLSFFQLEHGFRKMPIGEAFAQARSPIKVNVGEKVVDGLPGFGALDAPNVHPFASGIQNGLNLIEDLHADDHAHIVDLGAGGYGSTSMIILSLLDEKLRRKVNDYPQVTVHLIDPSFGEEYSRLAKLRPYLFQFHEATKPTELSQTSKSYLPPSGMPVGYSTLRLIEEHPSLLNRLERKGVTIIVHSMGADEFFENNREQVEGKTLVMAVDGNHGIAMGDSAQEEGDRRKIIQPLQDITNGAPCLMPGGVMVCDDYKATPNCGLVMAAVNTVKILSNQQSLDQVESAIDMSLQQLATDLGPRRTEWENKFPDDPRKASNVLYDPDKVFAASQELSVARYGATPVVVLQRHKEADEQAARPSQS